MGGCQFYLLSDGFYEPLKRALLHKVHKLADLSMERKGSMEKVILLGVLIVLLAVLGSGMMPVRHELFDCNYNILANPPKETCYVAEVHYDDGWLVKMMREQR
jgi:hypothetical protein